MRNSTMPAKPRKRRALITQTTVLMPVRVEPELRDGLDEIAATGGMSRDQLLRATFRGMLDAWREVQKTIDENPSLFADLNRRTDAAIDRAAQTAVNPPVSQVRSTARDAMKASGIKPRQKTRKKAGKPA